MNCAECKDLLVEYLEGLLDEAQKQTIDEHVKDCEACRAEWEGLAALQQRLVGNGKALAQRDLEDEVMTRIFREQNARLKAAQAGAGLRIRRLIMTSPISKFAVAATVVVAAVIGIYTVGHSQPAFAEVVKPILTARTAVYKLVGRMQDQPAMTIEGQFMEPAKVRHIVNFDEPGGPAWTQIMDHQQGKGLVLVPAQKMAMVMELKDQPDLLAAGMFNPFEAYRQIIQQAQENPDESVQYLGESRIQGRKVIGYRVMWKDAGMGLTIWADAESLLPLQIEISLEKMMGEPSTVTMMDIQFDVPLDPAEFSLDVPEGYMEQTMEVDASMPTEEDLIATLQVWTELSDGKFPSELNMGAIKELDLAFAEKGPKPDKEKGFSDPAVQEFVQLFQKISRGLTFTMALPEEADWHYAGADAAFGDATRPVFWYRPEGSETYRVVYADLSVLDVAFDELPK